MCLVARELAGNLRGALRDGKVSKVGLGSGGSYQGGIISVEEGLGGRPGRGRGLWAHIKSPAQQSHPIDPSESSQGNSLSLQC